MSYSLLYLTQGLAEALHILRAAGICINDGALPLASVENRRE